MAKETEQKNTMHASDKGQNTIEFAGSLVLSAFVVSGLFYAANQIMPSLFQLLAQHNQAQFTEGVPATVGQAPPAPTPVSGG